MLALGLVSLRWQLALRQSELGFYVMISAGLQCLVRSQYDLGRIGGRWHITDVRWCLCTSLILSVIKFGLLPEIGRAHV